MLNQKENISERSLLSNIFSTLRLAPLHFFLLQLPEGLSSALANLLEVQFENKPLLALLLFFPLFFIASTVSSALTFSSVARLYQQEKLSFWKSWKEIQNNLWVLVLAALVIGTISLMSLAALVLPAFYFMALYLFVPQLILSEPHSKLSVYLFRSTRIVKKSLWGTIATVIGAFLIGILTYLISQTIGTWVGGFFTDNAARTMVILTFDIVFCMLTGAVVNIWIAFYFFKIRNK